LGTAILVPFFCAASAQKNSEQLWLGVGQKSPVEMAHIFLKSADNKKGVGRVN
jgi:hypothetical protein